MTAIRRIAFITRDYPSKDRQDRYVFVQKFVHAVARQGVNCTVIQPVPIHRALNLSRQPYYSVERLDSGEEVTVLRPLFLSLSAREWFARMGPLNLSRLTFLNFTKAAQRAIELLAPRPDAIYGHFLYFGGAAAVRVGAALGIRSFLGLGESVKRGTMMWSARSFGLKFTKKQIVTMSGVIANSSLLKEIVVQQLGIEGDQIGIFPNGANITVFRPRNRKTSRKEFGLPIDAFLVGCVGQFSERKGQERVLNALRGLENTAGVFVGRDISFPLGPHVAHNRSQPHESIPVLLAACDVFVLPSLEEGCCNAIVEAMACGLPIISSIGAFNDDVLDESMSIRVDPMDVGAIRAAIIRLRDNPELRERMSKASLERSRMFDINDRAKRILDFMNSRTLHCSTPQ